MTRTPVGDAPRQLALRLPASLIERLDAHAERMRRSTPGVTLSRADAIRTLLITALDAAEAAASKA